MLTRSNISLYTNINESKIFERNRNEYRYDLTKLWKLNN